jgi:hypothetical protein
MSKKPTYKIPFSHKDGKSSMMSYTSARPGVVRQPQVAGVHQSPYIPNEWRDITEFDAELKMVGSYKGRSSVRIRVQNTGINESYSFGLSGFYEAVVAFGVSPGGSIRGRWTYRKQGTNYALHPVIP